MLDQEDYPELDYGWLNSYERLTQFRKAREQLLRRVEGSELPSDQVPQSSE